MIMQIISLLYKTVLDALFPLSEIESEMLSITPEEALLKLPPAPGYAGLAVDLQNAKSVFAYKDERVAKLVWNIKYKKSKRAVKIGGYALWRTVKERPENLLPSPIVMIPIPITERRRKERGYNQCELLIEEIGRLDVEKRFRIESNLLVRTQHVARQTLKGRKDRIESAQGIFAVNKHITTEELERMKSSIVVIIDDVITTGSTMFEAVETLKTAGFLDVRAISLAH